MYHPFVNCGDSDCVYSKSASAAFADTVSGAMCFINLFRQSYLRVSQWSSGSFQTAENQTYSTVVSIVGVLLAVFDGQVHFKMYTQRKIRSQPDGLSARHAELQRVEQGNMSWGTCLATLCTFACALEAVSVPFLVDGISKDLGFIHRENSTTENIVLLSLTAFSILINFFNSVVTFRFNKDVLGVNETALPLMGQGAREPLLTSPVVAKDYTALKSITRAVFLAVGRWVENTNLVIKSAQTIAGLWGKESVFDNVTFKMIALAFCAVPAFSVCVVRYLTYVYYQPKSAADKSLAQPEPVQTKGKCTNTSCKGCSSKRSTLPSRPSEDYATKSGVLLDEKTASRFAQLCTFSDSLKRISAPFSFIALYYSSEFLDDSSSVKTIGLVLTALSIVVHKWNSSVVYDFNLFNCKRGGCGCCDANVHGTASKSGLAA